MEYLKKHYPYIVSLILLAVYIITLAPSVMQIDTGELAAVQAVAGIAHPTGYPLFTILGYLFLLIPLPFTKIYQANLLAAIYCAASAFFFIKTIFLLIDHSTTLRTADIKTKKGNKKGKTGSFVFALKDKIAASLFGVFIIGFNLTFWMQSTSTEVYSLQALLFATILYAASRFQASANPSLKECLILAGAAALGFTNHMTTLLIIPGLIFLYFSKMGFGKESLKRIPLMAGVFAAIIIILYSYLYIRASQNPLLSWGDTSSFDNLLRHISGRQYSVWLFSSIEEAKNQLSNYVSQLPKVFGFFPLFFTLAGIPFIFKLNRKLFHFFLITYIFSVLYTINYSIHDIESYFLLSYIILGIFASFGALKMLNYFRNKSLDFAAGAGLLGLVVLISFLLNYRMVNSSGTYVYEDYTKAVIGSLPQNSIVFSYQWDYFISSSYYFRLVENYRNDITVIDKELLRRSWYYKQTGRNYPGLFDGVREEVNSFIKEVRIFEAGGNFNPERLEFYYQSIMTNLISANINKRDYFIGPELIDSELRNGQFRLPQGTTAVPYGLLYKVTASNEYVPGPALNFRIRFPEELDNYSGFIYRQIPGMLLRRAQYELQYGMKDKAKEIIQIVRRDYSGTVIPDFLIKEAGN